MTDFVKKSAILEIKNLKKSFGGLKAVNNCSFAIKEGSILGLAGPNGAGKTVTFNLITGELRPDSGKVIMKGEDITGLPPHKVIRKGIARTFQLVRIYPEMTVLDNLLFAAQEKGIFENACSLLTGVSLQDLDRKNERKALEILEKVDLTRLKDEKARNLSYGQRKILEFANAMMTYPEPEIIMLDEPMAGVNPTMMNNLATHIRDFNEIGKTLVIIEHNMRLIMDLCDRIVVLCHGEKIAEGSPSEIQENPEVINAYFGE